MMLPTGTVTFLFTDIEGSTRLWESYPAEMRQALSRHDALIRDAVEGANGVVFRTVGDAFCCAFAVPLDALEAALAAQVALHAEPWPDETPIRVRMAIHIGAVEQERNDYVGAPLNRIARLLATAHGGQTLLSQAVYELVRDHPPEGVELVPLGEHRLKDLARPETVYQPGFPGLRNDFPPLRSLGNASLPNNLPEQTTSFVGRGKELAVTRELLSKSRLLTLTGSGGTGKTRLSLHVAADVLDEYPGGVWFIELAPLTDPDLVPRALAQVLGVKEVPGKSLVESLYESLKAKKSLIVLDNCEHLIEASSRLVDGLLRACPDLTVLASSREGLGVTGEQIYRVPSLLLPDPKRSDAPEVLSQYEAVRLFIERARLARPDFVVTNENAPALAQICHRLDGIPLALELAAARLRSLSVDEICARLDNRFRLLTGGSRVALPRQQTLRALIDWSYDLLSGPEKLFLRRLSVFSGGWTLEAAENVCAGESPTGETIEDWDVLDLLTSMVDKSLVFAEIRQGATRYRLLETVRQYAADRLRETGEEPVARSSHFEYYLRLAEQVAPELGGANQRDQLDRVEVEHDNLRAALQRHPDSPDHEAVVTQARKRLRLAASLWRFWDVRGHLSEGRRHYADVLNDASAQEPTQNRANALQGAGALARHQSDYVAADQLFQECAAIRRSIGDETGLALALNNLGANAYDRGEYTVARAYFEESLSIRRRLGVKRRLAPTLLNLGNVLNDIGDYAAALASYQESLDLFREVGDLGNVAIALVNLGNLARNQNDLVTARPLYEESLALSRELDDRRTIALVLVNLGPLFCGLGEFNLSRAALTECLTLCRQMGIKRITAFAFEAYAELTTATDQAERAVTLFGAASVLRGSIGSPLPPSEQDEVDRKLDTLRASIGEDLFVAAWERGQQMSLEQAMEYVLEDAR